MKSFEIEKKELLKCNSIESEITIPKNVTVIGWRAFMDNNYIKK